MAEKAKKVSTEKRSLGPVFTKGIIRENPIFRLVLGMCSSLAVSGTMIGSLGMGLSVIFVLVMANIVISLLRNVIPDTVRIPAYITVIAGFVTITQLLLQAFRGDVYELLGVYLPLIVVNCIILGRAEAFASKNTVGVAALDGLGMGVGFTVAMLSIAFIRELIGHGSLFGYQILSEEYTIMLFALPAGAFMAVGVLMAVWNKVAEMQGKPRAGEDCSGCPSAGHCGQQFVRSQAETVQDSEEKIMKSTAIPLNKKNKKEYK